MKAFTRLLFTSLLAGLATVSRAQIQSEQQLSIDFTNPVSASANATWSDPGNLTISKEGLGWDSEAAALRQGWIQTQPLALGVSWRPAPEASVRVALQPPPREITLSNGQKSMPYTGAMYVRYSPDLQHWSTWQVLTNAEPLTPEEKENPGRYFKATLQVPERERRHYNELLEEYAHLEVPWASDEEAAVRWILQREPDFFAKQIPFIGYVQLLYEGDFYGGQRLRSLQAEVLSVANGMAATPKDPAASKGRENSPWKFVAAKPKPPPPTMEQLLAAFASLKVGMTRAEVEQRFTPDGGIGSASQGRYLVPGFPYLKIDVYFESKRGAADQNRAIESKDDKVIRVSKPYLERMNFD